MTEVVFVTGCSRSGTTALVNVLNSHPSIVIGMERYKYVYPNADSDELARLFEPTRFMDLRPDDTNVLPKGTNRWYRLYEKARAKFDSGSVSLIGDKPMASQSVAAKLHKAYPTARWVFIFRDLPHVAASFEARANNPHDRSWPLRNGFRSAHRQWSDAFRTARMLEDLVAPEQIYRVAYDQFFARDLTQVDALRAFLAVEPSEEQDEYYRESTRDWEARQSRPVELYPAALEWLEEQRPADLETRFRRLARADAQYWAGV